MTDIGKILPVDGYKTSMLNSLPIDYLESLFHLYQPLIGMEAVNLYQLLQRENAIFQEGQLQTHHTLMNYLNLPLDRIYRARLKLEGIGLLKTYQYQGEDKHVYTYEILAPFRPSAFFQDIMLAELLLQHIGESKFMTLKKHYSKARQTPLGENITVSFKDVFQTFTPKNEKTVTALEEKNGQGQGIELESLDFTYLQQMLTKKMIPAEKVLTEVNQRIMNQLKTLYDLDVYEIEKSLLWALTDENLLDTEQFKAACLDLFRAKHNTAKVGLTEKQQVQAPTKGQPQKGSKTDHLIQHLETITPKHLLEDLSAGQNASEQDMKMISDIMTKQGLPVPVMNVAIYYVMLQTNMKLSKAYLETIASHWSRLNLKTAKEAMAFALKEIQPKAKPKRNYSPAKKSQEIIPDWFKNRKTKNTKEQVTTAEPQMIDKEHDEMIALLQRHASKK